MKKSKRAKINNILKVFLILIETAAVVNCCAVINVFSQINAIDRQKDASSSLVVADISNTDFEPGAVKIFEDYEEEHRWKGPVLSKRAGTITGPSGKETYYNLNMAGVVRIMRRMGNEDEYWVRDDGVKMLGDYVMVAADLNLRPRGSLVETSLGTGIVCDTGGFAARNPTQLDIAVAW